MNLLPSFESLSALIDAYILTPGMGARLTIIDDRPPLSWSDYTPEGVEAVPTLLRALRIAALENVPNPAAAIEIIAALPRAMSKSAGELEERNVQTLTSLIVFVAHGDYFKQIAFSERYLVWKRMMRAVDDTVIRAALFPSMEVWVDARRTHLTCTWTGKGKGEMTIVAGPQQMGSVHWRAISPDENSEFAPCGTLAHQRIRSTFAAIVRADRFQYIPDDLPLREKRCRRLFLDVRTRSESLIAGAVPKNATR